MGIFSINEETVECTHCEGSGEITINGFMCFYSRHPCKKCNGSGKIKKNVNIIIISQIISNELMQKKFTTFDILIL